MATSMPPCERRLVPPPRELLPRPVRPTAAAAESFAPSPSLWQARTEGRRVHGGARAALARARQHEPRRHPLPLADRLVSRRHAAFELAGAQLRDHRPRIDERAPSSGDPRRRCARLESSELVRISETVLRVEALGVRRRPSCRHRAVRRTPRAHGEEMRRLYPLASASRPRASPSSSRARRGTSRRVLARGRSRAGTAGGRAVRGVRLHRGAADARGVWRSSSTSAAPPPARASARGVFERRTACCAAARRRIGDLDLQPAGQHHYARSSDRRCSASARTAGSALDIRVLAATHAISSVRSGGSVPGRSAFPARGGRIRLPPLRRRRGDITVLAHRFVPAARGPRRASSRGSASS